MSVQRAAGAAATTDNQQRDVVQLEVQPIGSSSSSSSLRQPTNSSQLVVNKKSKVEEADEDLFTVPDVEARPAAAGAAGASKCGVENVSGGGGVGSHRDQSSGKRRRGRNPVDKEHKRIKRLLRNRVSAQQARERKKVYVNELESRALDLHDTNSKLEEKISTLINENTMLRKILMNTRPKPDENAEPTKKL